MQKTPIARITGIGAYLPQRILSNAYFENMVDTNDEWIVSRTGIKERRIAADDEYTSTMGTAAAKGALESAGLTAQDIQMIIVATMSPDYVSSSTASLIQAQLGATHAAAIDVQAACTGFLYALATAKAFVESGMYANVLVVASEKMSSFVDYSDRRTSILFGDGAGAVVVSGKGKGLKIDALRLGSDGDLAQLIVVPAGGVRMPASKETVEGRMHYFRMEGKEVFKHAVRRMSVAANECLADAGLTQKEISWMVPHQANLRIIDAIAKGFELPSERIFKTVHKYGNTSASSIVIAMKELFDEHAINEGEHLLLVAFGAGLTWGAAVLTQVAK